jgi:hypothetical protein
VKQRRTLKLTGMFFAFVLLIALISSLGWAANSRAFTQVQKLEVASGSDNGYLGFSLDMEGDTAIAGFFGDEEVAGGAFIFERENDQWIEKHKLSLSSTVPAGLVGWSVAIDEEWAVLGAITDSVEGAAYVFHKLNDDWVAAGKLIANDRDGAYDFFGNALALSGNLLVIGAHQHDHDGDPINHNGRGAVYIFEYQNELWTQQQKLMITPGYDFGYDVAIEDQTIFVGAHQGPSGDDQYNGAVYVYEQVDGLWTQQQKLVASDHNHHLGFGFSVAVSGNKMIIGAVDLNSNSQTGNAAYVFEKVEDQWIEQEILLPDNVLVERFFGYDVGIQNNVLVVTSPQANDDPASGSAYVFTQQNELWVKQQKLFASDALLEDEFGVSIGLIYDTLLIGSGACGAISAEKCPGAVYAYTASLIPTPTPTLTQTPDDPSSPPTPTATNTPLPDGTTELLVNGGFEFDADSNQTPDGWKLKHASDDKLKCNKPQKTIAFEGMCIFQFKGGESERSKLQQEIDLAAYPISVGDTLMLSGQVWAKGDVDSKVTLKTKYASLPTDKLTINVPSTGKQWTPFSALQPSLSITIADIPGEIILQLKHESPSGKVRYDAISLTRQSNALIPLGVPQ